MKKACETPISGISPSKNAGQCLSENSVYDEKLQTGQKKSFSAPTVELTMLDWSDIVATSGQDKGWSRVYPL